MEELLETFDINGNFLGVKPKSFCHGENPECYHKTVWIWIIDSRNRVLVQKRASSKKYMPDKWDMSSAGHVPESEDFLSACVRETEEELGLKFAKENFIFQREFLQQYLHEFGQVYLLKADFGISDVTLQKEEVAEIKWLSLEEFKSLLYSDAFVPHERAYKDWVCEMLKANFR